MSGTARPGYWIIAGTPVGDPYPCRCHERKYAKCSPMWCPCAGRTDIALTWANCCASVNTPEVVAEAAVAYERKRAAGLA